MSDDSAPAKRGRKATEKTEKKEKVEKAEKAENNDKGDSKKRQRKEAKPVDNAGDSEDGAAPVKRGRGRPKGSTKKKNTNAAKPKSKGTGLFPFSSIINLSNLIMFIWVKTDNRSYSFILFKLFVNFVKLTQVYLVH